MIVIIASVPADNNNENDEDLQRALAISMDNHKEIDRGDPNKVDDATVEEKVKRPAYLPLPEEPKGDRNLLCKVGVRLPDGRRIQRNFLRTDPVQVDVLTTGLTELFYFLNLFWILPSHPRVISAVCLVIEELTVRHCIEYYSQPSKTLVRECLDFAENHLQNINLQGMFSCHTSHHPGLPYIFSDYFP